MVQELICFTKDILLHIILDATKIKSKYPEIKSWKKDAQLRIIPKENMKQLFKEFMPEILLKYISKWIYRKIRNTKEETFEITKKLFPEMEKQKYKIKQINMEKEKTK